MYLAGVLPAMSAQSYIRTAVHEKKWRMRERAGRDRAAKPGHKAIVSVSKTTPGHDLLAQPGFCLGLVSVLNNDITSV